MRMSTRWSNSFHFEKSIEINDGKQIYVNVKLLRMLLCILATLEFLIVSCCVTDSGKMTDKMVPIVRATEDETELTEEQEIVDPQQQLRDECSQKPEAQNLWSKYQECNDRVNSRSQTSETCEEELIDYIHVLDKCVNKDLFKRLK